MKIYPAIDLYEGKAVRLFKGDYAQMTVYGNDPAQIALDFRAKGADRVHVVDLEGAKNGTTPNFDTVCRIKNESGLFVEIGGGIRSFDVMAPEISFAPFFFASLKKNGSKAILNDCVNIAISIPIL